MNSSSRVDIYNMALGAVGVSRTVNDTAEGTIQANVCNQFWNNVVDSCLQDFPWGFAMRYAPLQLISKTVPNWLNVYALPSDCLQAREISLAPSTQNIPWGYRGKKIPFAIIENEASGGLALACNLDSPTLAYTARILTIPLWSPAFVNAVYLLLASRIVSPLSSEPTKYAPIVAKAYDMAILKAGALSMNEGHEHHEHESELISIRG